MMIASLALLTKANTLLDEIGGSDAAERFDPTNTLILEDMRSQMSELGFASPLMFLIQQTKDEMEIEPEDAADARKHMREIKYIANLKKFTFNRVRVALAAHKIAEGMKLRHDPALQFLPLGGEYVAQMAKAGNAAVFAYGEVMDEFTRGRRAHDRYTAIVNYRDKKGENKSVEFKLSMSEKISDKVKYIYGDSAEVKSIKISKAEPPLIKSKASRIALLTAFASQSALEVKREMLEDEKKDSRLQLYNNILRKAGIMPDTPLEAFEEEEQFSSVVKELAAKGLLAGARTENESRKKSKNESRKEAGKEAKNETGNESMIGESDEGSNKERKEMAGTELMLEESLADEIFERQAKARSEMFVRTSERLLLPIFKFYMTRNEAEREQGNIYPSLATSPTEKQLDILNLLSHRSLKGIPLASRLVARKLEAEGMSSGIPAPAFGAAFLSLEANKDMKSCANMFGVAENEVKSAVSKLESVRTGRGAEFLKKTRGK